MRNNRFTNIQFAKALDEVRNQRESVVKMKNRAQVGHFIKERLGLGFVPSNGTVSSILIAANITLARDPNNKGGGNLTSKIIVKTLCDICTDLGKVPGPEFYALARKLGLSAHLPPGEQPQSK